MLKKPGGEINPKKSSQMEEKANIVVYIRETIVLSQNSQPEWRDTILRCMVWYHTTETLKLMMIVPSTERRI